MQDIEGWPWARSMLLMQKHKLHYTRTESTGWSRHRHLYMLYTLHTDPAHQVLSMRTDGWNTDSWKHPQYMASCMKLGSNTNAVMYQLRTCHNNLHCGCSQLRTHNGLACVPPSLGCTYGMKPQYYIGFVAMVHWLIHCYSTVIHWVPKWVYPPHCWMEVWHHSAIESVWSPSKHSRLSCMDGDSIHEVLWFCAVNLSSDMGKFAVRVYLYNYVYNIYTTV